MFRDKSHDLGKGGSHSISVMEAPKIFAGGPLPGRLAICLKLFLADSRKTVLERVVESGLAAPKMHMGGLVEGYCCVGQFSSIVSSSKNFCRERIHCHRSRDVSLCRCGCPTAATPVQHPNGIGEKRSIGSASRDLVTKEVPTLR